MGNLESTEELPAATPKGPYRVSVQYERENASRLLPAGTTLVVGSGQEADLRVSDSTVSAVHCEVRADESGVVIEDRNSKNGLFVGAGRVTRAVLSGDRAEVVIGRTTIVVEARRKTLAEDHMGLLGDSDLMRALRADIRRYAKLKAPVLVLGESGTGKDRVAQALYQASELRGSYIATNVAALSESLLDAELFGHTKGAFTGAIAARAGAFQLADRGLLFLDEIAELCPAGQAKLLRVVEDGRVRPVGAERELQVNTRLVFATCAPLAERVLEGRFREDLFHRISVLTLMVPPLRARRLDIPILARGFLEAKVDELGHRVVSEPALDFLMRQRWSGNVRQLFACLYAACAGTTSELIAPCHLRVSEPDERGFGVDPAAALRLLDAAGSVSAAARLARIPRTTFRGLVAKAKAK